jgi:hypothetical protein
MVGRNDYVVEVVVVDEGFGYVEVMTVVEVVVDEGFGYAEVVDDGSGRAELPAVAPVDVGC